MKIEKIKINSYGTLKEKEINLKNNINIIYGKNESGKSTLLNFIKNVFYGIAKTKNGKEISDYEKYCPWTGENFSGKIEYKLEDEKKYEVYRDFNKKNPKIFNENLDDISQEFTIDKKDGNMFFYEQTGITQETYMSTIMAAQQEVVISTQTQNVLVQKIANLGGTGSEDISFKKAIEKLNKRQLEEVGTTRTQDRPINILQNRNKQIELELKDEQKYFENKQILTQQKEEIQEKLEKEKQKNNLINELIKILKEKEIELEKSNIKNKIKDENEEKIKKIIDEENEFVKNNIEENKTEKSEQKIENQNKQVKRNYNIFSIITVVLIIANILNFIFIPNKIINYLLLLILPVEITLAIIYHIKSNKKISSLQNEIEEEKQKIQKVQEQIAIYDTQINLLREEIEKQQKEITNQKEKINFAIEQEKQKVKEKYLNFENSELFNIQQKYILEQEKESSNQKIMNYQIQLNSMKYEEKNVGDKIEKIILLKEEQSNIQEKLQILEQKNKCFQITKEFLENAIEKMQNSVTPKFTQNLSNIMQNISNGKYKKISIHEEKGLIVELENGEYVLANRLSIGTIDQLYLALRLSMLDEIAKEKMPIILDESFAYFDDERLKNILTFLNKQNNHQIILLTCTKREKEILDKLQIEHEWIEL